MQLAKYAIYQARLREEDPAIGFSGGVANYRLLAKSVEAAVKKIVELGLPEKEPVAVFVNNPVHHVAISLALQLLGRPSASIFTPAQIEFADAKLAALITDKAGVQLGSTRVVNTADDWFIVDPQTPPNYTALMNLPGFASPDDLAQVFFSSGTTGYPKAITTTAGTVERATFVGSVLHAGPHSHAVRCLSMTGVAGSAGLILYVLSQGGFIAFAMQPQEVLNLVRVFELEALFASVGQLQSLVAALGSGLAPRSLRTVVGFGSKVPLSLLEEVRGRLCPNFNMMYSSTDAGLMSHATAAQLALHEGCAGHVLPDIQIEIVNEAHEPVPHDQDGIIRVRTPFQNHYLAATSETDAMFRDGWFYPGDVGRLSVDNLLTVTGRTTELINRGGVIVAPEMIEESIRRVPGIKDVAVFGVPDKDGLDRIWAAVVSENWVDEGAIRVAVAARMPDRVPDRVVQIDAIPRTETSKIKRGELRTRYSQDAL